MPCAIKHDVQVSINWHELRILVMWADNWDELCAKKDLEHKPGVVKAIAAQLMKFKPASNAGGLTLFEEIAELQQTFPGASLVIEDGLGGVTTQIPGKKVM